MRSHPFWLLQLCLALMSPAEAFFVPSRPQQQKQLQLQRQQQKRACSSLCMSKEAAVTPEALTAFMAKAHEEKLRALTEMENKYKGKIEELEEKLSQYERDGKAMASSASDSETGISTSFEFPATNKALGEKVRAYQNFLSMYLVKSQSEKKAAVEAAEKKVAAKYEAIIAKMKESATPPAEEEDKESE